MRSHIWLKDTRDVPLLAAELGAQAGVVGAARAALDHVPVNLETHYYSPEVAAQLVQACRQRVECGGGTGTAHLVF